jgi:uncharacterized protein (TIGR03437 family)
MAPVQPSLAIMDEIYQFRDFSRSRSRVLMTVDAHSIDLTLPGVNPGTEDFPSAWCHLYGAGRVFYSALGHFDETWRDDRFQRLLLGGLLWVTRQMDGDASPRNPAPPIVPAGAVANSASYQPPMTIAAGSWFTIFGGNLTTGSALADDSHATFYKLGGTVVKVNGAAVPLNYASPSQINAYLPLDTAIPAPSTFEITVSAAGGDASHTNAVPVKAADTTPGVFATTLQGGYLTIWATGLGPVVSNGQFQLTKTTPVVRIGGVGSRILFSGLAPGWQGIYQVNVELPANYTTPSPVEFCFNSYCQMAGSI